MYEKIKIPHVKSLKDVGIVGSSCWLFYGNVQMSLQLQSNLIPGLNLNALGLFPSGSPGMGPSMSSVPPPGAHGGCSFGVSCPPCHSTLLMRTADCWSGHVPEAEVPQDLGQFAATTQRKVLSFMFLFSLVQSLWGWGATLGFYDAGEQPAPRCKSPVIKCFARLVAARCGIGGVSVGCFDKCRKVLLWLSPSEPDYFCFDIFCSSV